MLTLRLREGGGSDWPVSRPYAARLPLQRNLVSLEGRRAELERIDFGAVTTITVDTLSNTVTGLR